MSLFNNNHKDKGQRPSILSFLKRGHSIHKASKASQQAEAKDASNEAQSGKNTGMTEEEMLAHPDRGFLKMEVASLKRSLSFPANVMTPGSAIRMCAKMKTPAKKIQTNSWAYFFGMIAAVILTPLVLPMFNFGTTGEDIAIGIALAAVVYMINYYTVKTEYNNYSFKNEMRFNKVLTVLDLSEIKRGYSINALLAQVAVRFRDKTLSNAIQTLNSRIQDHPQSVVPYLAFANEFSTTQRARLFMESVYRMAQGFYDDSEIKSIKHSAAKDLTYQSEKLMHHKLRRFNKLWIMQFSGFVIYLIVYVLYFIGLDLFDTFKEVM